MLIIGSHALRQHLLVGRASPDIDVIGTYEDVSRYVKGLSGELTQAYPFDDGKKYLFVKKDRQIIEAEIAWEGSLAEEFLLLMADCNTYASLNGLYALKLSHRYLRNSPHFMKTMHDINLMREAGATITDDLVDFLKRREAETYDYSHPNLNTKKKSFFAGDGISYVYDHDSIHESVKQQDRPAYSYFKPSNNEVMVSRQMFDQLELPVQLNSVLEESYVLAIERSQVPFPNTLSPRRSFDIALQKVCTSITSGWWREFAWENYHKVVTLYDDSYIDRFWAGVDTGVVTAFK